VISYDYIIFAKKDGQNDEYEQNQYNLTKYWRTPKYIPERTEVTIKTKLLHGSIATYENIV